MSLTLVKPYFITQCKAASLKEWPYAFNIENVPNSIIDNSFHVLLNTVDGIKLNQHVQELNCGASVTFWIKGYKDPSSGLDKAIAKSEELLKLCLKPSNRIGTCVKNIILNSVNFDRLADSNDNAIKVTMIFTALTSLAVD